MEVVNTLDIDGSQWELQDVEARNKIAVLEKSFNSLADYKKDIEINTGAKWIDNKPIYRKVFYSPTNWRSGTIIGNIGNFDTVIKITSTTQYGNGNWFTDYNSVGIENTAFVDPNANVIIATAGQFQNNFKALVIVEYTKTTD